jgi:hypothetical protein
VLPVRNVFQKLSRTEQSREGRRLPTCGWYSRRFEQLPVGLHQPARAERGGGEQELAGMRLLPVGGGGAGGDINAR